MASRAYGRVGMVAAITLAVLAWGNQDSIYDFLVEGDDDPEFLRRGRHGGTWEFRGDARELAEFADETWHRIQFEVDERDPGRGLLHIRGAAQPFTLQVPGDAWLCFEGHLPGLTARAEGDRFEILLEAARLPENDWLFVFFEGVDDSRTGFAYSRL